MKHNMEQEGLEKEYERQKNGKNSMTVNGLAINEFARLDQANAENKNKN